MSRKVSFSSFFRISGLLGIDEDHSFLFWLILFKKRGVDGGTFLGLFWFVVNEKKECENLSVPISNFFAVLGCQELEALEKFMHWKFNVLLQTGVFQPTKTMWNHYSNRALVFRGFGIIKAFLELPKQMDINF